MMPEDYECGNPRKLKKLVTRFRENSTIHGTGYVSQKRSTCCFKFLWKTIFIACFLGVISSITNIIIEFSESSEFITTTEKKNSDGVHIDPLFPIYPRITICRKPPWPTEQNSTAEALAEYGFLALGFPWDSFGPVDFVDFSENTTLQNNASEIVQKRMKALKDAEHRYSSMSTNNTNFSPQKFIENNSLKCEDIFIYCVYLSILSFNCCDEIKPILTSAGMCYSFIVNYPLMIEEDMTFPWGKHSAIDMHSPKKGNYRNAEGFTVFASHPFENVQLRDPLNAEYLLSGTVTNIDISLTVIDRRSTYTPWYGYNEACPVQPWYVEPNKTLGERFDVRACETQNMFYALEKNCNCRPALLPDRGRNLRICEPKDTVYCFLETNTKLPKEDRSTESSCDMPCLEYQFQTSSTVAYMRSPNITRLVFRYNTNHHTLKTVRTISVSSFLSQLGGSLGLYFGASIVSVVEIGTFISSFLWYRFVPSRKRVKGIRTLAFTNGKNIPNSNAVY